MKDELKPKQRRFVIEFLVDQNAKQAAIRAGYSKKAAEVNGPRLLRNARVKAAVDAQLKKIEEQNIVTVKYVLENLKEVTERCMQHKPVMVFDKAEREMVQAEEDGEGLWEFDSAGANRSLELLGKHLKMFTEKHEIAGKNGESLVVEIIQQGSGKPWRK